MRVVVFTSSALRHKAFASMVSNSKNLEVVGVFHEQSRTLNEVIKNNQNIELQAQHLLARDQAEKDFFGLFLDNLTDNEKSQLVPRQWFSSSECIDTLEILRVDLILVYGTSIIKGDIVDIYDKRILNVHLGLSPYYIGDGTNYFPFVNFEPEYCGATYMYLSKEVDSGEIIHQVRPYILSKDSFHQLSNRFLVKVFKIYILIAESFSILPSAHQNHVFSDQSRKLYKMRDFTQASVETLYKNFSLGMIEDYLSNYELRNNLVPIIENPLIKSLEEAQL